MYFENTCLKYKIPFWFNTNTTSNEFIIWLNRQIREGWLILEKFYEKPNTINRKKITKSKYGLCNFKINQEMSLKI